VRIKKGGFSKVDSGPQWGVSADSIGFGEPNDEKADRRGGVRLGETNKWKQAGVELRAVNKADWEEGRQGGCE